MKFKLVESIEADNLRSSKDTKLSEGFSWIKAGDIFHIDNGNGIERYLVVTTYDKESEKHLNKYERYVKIAREEDGKFSDYLDVEYSYLAGLKKSGKLIFESLNINTEHRIINEMLSESDYDDPIRVKLRVNISGNGLNNNFGMDETIVENISSVSMTPEVLLSNSDGSYHVCLPGVHDWLKNIQSSIQDKVSEKVSVDLFESKLTEDVCSRTFYIHSELVLEREKSIGVKVTRLDDILLDCTIWLPRSQCKVSHKYPYTVVNIPEWLYKKEFMDNKLKIFTGD